VEAEALFGDLMLIYKQVDGADGAGTLVTRHEIARALLEQGRAVEAETLFRDLLPICERVNGADASTTFVTRYVYALAQLGKGDAAAAQATLDGIPDLAGRENWLPRHAARLAYVRGRVADALERQGEGVAHLTESRRIYVEIFPPDHYHRRQLEDYITQRGGI
jgi:hypothetical protein